MLWVEYFINWSSPATDQSIKFSFCGSSKLNREWLRFIFNLIIYNWFQCIYVIENELRIESATSLGFKKKNHDQSFYWRPNRESIVNCSFIRSEHQSPTSIVHQEPFYKRYRRCYSRLQKCTSMSRNVPHSDDRREIDVLLQHRPTAAGTQATGCRVF